jgi:ABC-type Fe3+-siderophore transport system permease subunit
MLGRSLNIMAHGELTATSLGVSVPALRRLIYVVASVFTAAAVTIAGTIGFVGLIVPHMLRLQASAITASCCRPVPCLVAACCSSPIHWRARCWPRASYRLAS